ncbi:YjjW family glycine radical enzyme activase [Shewanella eurypsychrophilus]|uniref:YjjW family glycine radical enzyme activase n=1 Tax=Shewanella eurypsychrophilus TaxID=2593656 RepID=A0ABX6V6S6_9GAMM|nr:MULTISPECIES: YjjW family glycine radical enzyme activase [Shewanella]QFU20664.1 YjjW family glycine radical enzyme activase [Shewanella sp. YLB-09]QFU20944.1 YjjW family glycine radical enzyme activase [Shewanella sp. YLB-09]QPG56232.1 YjjW family glycine radical enzyme activase [Shewanella eurypsychrophilus]
MSNRLSTLSKTASVNQIINFSCVDGPGSRLVIFLQGCNYNCKNCHNPHTIDRCDSCGDCIEHCPTQALIMTSTGGKNTIRWNSDLCSECDTCLAVCPRQSSPKTRKYNVDQLLEVIREQNPFISGITVSGGEASLQLHFVSALFQAIKTSDELQHLSCMIDSNGSLSELGWQKLLPYIDGAMIDLKAWQQETHRYITGRDNHKVFRSLKLLSQHNKLYEVRLLQIPGVTDFESEIDALASFLTQLPCETRIKLNAFQHHGVTGEALTWQTCSKDNIERLASQLTARGVKPIILPKVYI